MSITNAQLIKDALRNINVLNEVQALPAEMGTEGLRVLNQMMEMLKEDSFDVGWFQQSSTTDTAPIPDWCEMAVTYSLSVLLAPRMSAPLTPEVVALSSVTLSAAKRKLIMESLDNTDMSHLPEGLGHWGNRYDIVTDN